jgi:hypothetical protein
MKPTSRKNAEALQARLSKQTMTELIRRHERRVVERRPDPSDARAWLILLTARSRRFAPVAAAVWPSLIGWRKDGSDGAGSPTSRLYSPC